jgi:hypothetical protein
VADNGIFVTQGQTPVGLPLEWPFIVERSNNFLAKPFDIGSEDTSKFAIYRLFDLWGGYRNGPRINGENPTTQGLDLGCAAFRYIIDTAANKAYGTAVIRTLMKQVAMRGKWQWMGAYDYPLLVDGKRTDEIGYKEGRWLLRLLESYELVQIHPNMTQQRKDSVKSYFVGAGLYLANQIQKGPIGQCFPARLSLNVNSDGSTGNYNIRGRDAKPNGESYGKWVGQTARFCTSGEPFLFCDPILRRDTVSFLATNYNNRVATKAAIIGKVGCVFNDTGLVHHAKQYFTEDSKFGVWPSGSTSEVQRDGETRDRPDELGVPQQGSWNYQIIRTKAKIDFAVALIRMRNDSSLWNYKTNDGLHGTQWKGAGEPKSLRLEVRRLMWDDIGYRPRRTCFNLRQFTLDATIDTGTNKGQYIQWRGSTVAKWNRYWKNDSLMLWYMDALKNASRYPSNDGINQSASGNYYKWAGPDADQFGFNLLHWRTEGLMSGNKPTVTNTAPLLAGSTRTFNLEARLSGNVVPYGLGTDVRHQWIRPTGAAGGTGARVTLSSTNRRIATVTGIPNAATGKTYIFIYKYTLPNNTEGSSTITVLW